MVETADCSTMSVLMAQAMLRYWTRRLFFPLIWTPVVAEA